MDERKLGTRPCITCEKDALNMIKNGNSIELIGLAMSMGFDCPDMGFAQNICTRLLEFEDSKVRANAIIGLANIARRFGILDKRVLKPFILRELRNNIENHEIIKDAVCQINTYLAWNLGEKFLK
jgi:hypothetical protein